METMQLERLVTLAVETDTSALCAAWGVRPEAVLSVKRSERPMTIREVGALAALRGMTLADILAV